MNCHIRSGSVDVLVYDDGSCRPATDAEVLFFREVERLRKLCAGRPTFSIDYEEAPYNDPDLAKWVSSIDAEGKL